MTRVASQTASPDSVVRAEIEAYIRASTWFALHAMESRVGGKGVPAFATRQAGTINLGVFPQEDSSYIFKCVACGHESDRLHRVLTPQRVKWGRKPFPCPDPGGESRSTSISSTSCADGSYSCPQARSVVPPRRVCRTTTVQGLLPLHAISGKSP